MNGPKPSLLEMVTKYREKPIRRILQFDANIRHPLDNVDPADEDGHTVWIDQVWDFRATSLPVRVQIIPGISKRDALILLNKIMERIKEIPADDFSIYRGPEYNTDELPDELPY